MTGSTDAIAHVQEGIVVDVNPAWSELFGHADPGDLLGQPLMDMFDARSHAALKGALVAAAQGRWSGHALSVMALQPAGGSQPLELSFERFEFEGEPAVRLRVATQKRDLESLANQLEQAMRLDSRTGLLRRAAFIESAQARAAQPLKAGLRAVAYLSPDSFDNVELEYGPIVAEEVLDALSRRVQEQLQPGDLASRVAPHGVALLVERGNPRDQEAWLAKLRERIAAAAVAGRQGICRTHVQHRFGTAAQPWQLAAEGARDCDRCAACGSRSRRRPLSAPRGGERQAGDRRSRSRLGEPDQGCADGKPLPARAAADREPRR